jgi:2-methylcitrate dehydratase PrpD
MEKNIVRRGQFTHTERVFVWALSGLIASAAVVGLALGLTRGDWRLALASAGVLAVAVIYAWAAWLGRPLG